MKLRHTLIAAAILACLTGSASARGGNQTQALIKAYNASRYSSAEQLGEKVVARYPNDFTARYYLANTYVQLHKNEQAIGQYRICLNSGLEGPLKQYSSTALERLLKQKEQALMAAAKNGEKPADKEIKEFQKKLKAEAKQEQDRLRAEWRDEIARYERNNRGRSYSYNRGYGYGYGRRDSGYDERSRINEYYSKKLAELTSYEDSMLSQANCGKGRIRIQPGLSSSKVKNYVNYGDESDAVEIPVDNPLHAEAKSLGDVAPVTTKPATKSKAAHQTKQSKSKSRPSKAQPAAQAIPQQN